MLRRDRGRACIYSIYNKYLTNKLYLWYISNRRVVLFRRILRQPSKTSLLNIAKTLTAF